MRDGDQTGLWHKLEKGTAYVHILLPGAFNTDSRALHRTALFVGQVPWLGVYLGHIPGAAGAVNEFLEYSRDQAMKRLARGAITRDLFHYLVCRLWYTLIVAISSQFFTTGQRGPSEERAASYGPAAQ